MKKISGYIVLIAFLFIGCDKISLQKQQVYHYTISNNLLAHYNFHKGSYWVYRDSLTGNEDSFYVTDYYSGSNVPIDDHSEKKIYDYVTFFLGHTCTHPIYTSDTMPIEIYLMPGSMAITVMGNNVQLPDTFTAGIDPIKNFYTTYSAVGIVFPNVYEINEPSYSHPLDTNKFNDWYYLSDSVGLVKMVINYPSHDTINKVWELERWKVVK